MPIREQAEQDLGFPIVSEPEFPPVIQRLVRQQPATFDVFSCFRRTSPSSGRPATCSPWRSPGCGAGRTSPRSTSSVGRSPAAHRARTDRATQPSAGSTSIQIAQAVGGARPAYRRASKHMLVQWVDESTGKTRRAGAAVLHGRSRHVQLRLLRLQRRRPREAARGAVVGGAPQPALAGTRRSQRRRPAGRASGRGECRPGSRPDEVRRSRRSDEKRDRPARQAPARVPEAGTVLQCLEAGPRAVDWMRAGDVVVCTMYAAQIASLAALGFPPPGRSARGLPGLRRAVVDLGRGDRPGDARRLLRLPQLVALGLRRRCRSCVGLLQRSPGDEPAIHDSGEYAYWIEGKPADRTYRGPYGDNSVRKDRCATVGRSRDGPAGSRAGTRHRGSSSTSSSAGRSSSPASSSPRTATQTPLPRRPRCASDSGRPSSR